MYTSLIQNQALLAKHGHEIGHLVNRPPLSPLPESKPTTTSPRRRVSRSVIRLLIFLLFHQLLLLLLLHLHLSLSLDIRAPGNSLSIVAVLQTPPGLTARDPRPAGSDPLPRAGDLTTTALSLARANVAVLLHDGGDLLPHALALGEAMYRPEHVVAQVGQEQKGVIVTVRLEGDLLLESEAVEDLVDKTGDLTGYGAVGAIGVAAVDERE